MTFGIFAQVPLPLQTLQLNIVSQTSFYGIVKFTNDSTFDEFLSQPKWNEIEFHVQAALRHNKMLSVSNDFGIGTMGPLSISPLWKEIKRNWSLGFQPFALRNFVSSALRRIAHENTGISFCHFPHFLQCSAAIIKKSYSLLSLLFFFLARSLSCHFSSRHDELNHINVTFTQHDCYVMN